MATIQLPRSQTLPLTGETAPITLVPPTSSFPPAGKAPDAAAAVGIGAAVSEAWGVIKATGVVKAARALLAAAGGAGGAEAGAAGAGVAGGGEVAGAIALAGLALSMTDPSRVVAMGPQSGLTVTPVTFQSTEQEGRWKPVGILDTDSKSRAFEIDDHLSNIPYMIDPLFPEGQAFGKLYKQNAKIFTITTAFGSSFTVDVTWWYDGLEIYGGYAGLASADGFGNVYSDMASVTLQAIPFGNYFPASALITWSGWCNPLGPTYDEFRGAFWVSANGAHGPINNYPKDASPCFMEHWGRGEERQSLPLDPFDGFTLNLKSGLPTSD